MLYSSETWKIPKLGSFIEKKKDDLQSLKTHLTNHRSTHPRLYYYVLDVFAGAIYWDPRLFCQEIRLKSLFLEILFLRDGKFCLVTIFQFVYFRAIACNAVSRLLILCWKTIGKPYYRNKKSQELGWLWAFVLPERQLCQS